MTPSELREQIQAVRYRLDTYANLHGETVRLVDGLAFLQQWIEAVPQSEDIDPLFSDERDVLRALAGDLRQASRELAYLDLVNADSLRSDIETTTADLDSLDASIIGDVAAGQEEALARISSFLSSRISQAARRSASVATSLGYADRELALLLDHPDIAAALYREVTTNPLAADATISFAFMPNAGHRIAIVAVAAGDPAAERYSFIRGDGPQTLSDMLMNWDVTRRHHDAIVEQSTRVHYLTQLAERLDAATQDPAGIEHPPTPAADPDHVPGPENFITALQQPGLDPATLSQMIATTHMEVARQERRFHHQREVLDDAAATAGRRVSGPARNNPDYARLLYQALMERDPTEARPGEIRLSDAERWALISDESAAVKLHLVMEQALGLEPDAATSLFEQVVLDPVRQAEVIEAAVAPQRVVEPTHRSQATAETFLTAYERAEWLALQAKTQLRDSLRTSRAQQPVARALARDPELAALLPAVDLAPLGMVRSPQWVSQLRSLGIDPLITAAGMGASESQRIDDTTRTVVLLAARSIRPEDTELGGLVIAEVEQVADWASTLEPHVMDIVVTDLARRHHLTKARLLRPLAALAAPAVLTATERTDLYDAVANAFEREVTTNPRNSGRLAVSARRGALAAERLERNIATGTAAVEEALEFATGSPSIVQPPTVPAPAADPGSVEAYAAHVRRPGVVPLGPGSDDTNVFRRFTDASRRTLDLTSRYREQASRLLRQVRDHPQTSRRERRAVEQSARPLQGILLPTGIPESEALRNRYATYGLTIGEGPGDDSPPDKARRRPSGPDRSGPAGGRSLRRGAATADRRSILSGVRRRLEQRRDRSSPPADHGRRTRSHGDQRHGTQRHGATPTGPAGRLSDVLRLRPGTGTTDPTSPEQTTQASSRESLTSGRPTADGKSAGRPSSTTSRAGRTGRTGDSTTGRPDPTGRPPLGRSNGPVSGPGSGTSGGHGPGS